MDKLKDHEFEFLINVALDTNDKEMFEDLTKRQKEGKFLDFPVQKLDTPEKEVLSFAAKERKRFINDLETIIRSYKNKPINQSVLEDFIGDVEETVNFIDERLSDQAFREDGTRPLKGMPLDFPMAPIQYTMISHEVAMEAYEQYRFPNESLDAFVERYFFSDGQEGTF